MQKIIFLSLLLCSQILYAKSIPFTIYHTNDLHSHFDGVKVSDEKNQYKTLGTFARLSTIIEKVRKEKESLKQIIIGVDAGDFFAGTIFSAIAVSSVNAFPEFEFLIGNKFDIITLGNHEFDANNIGFERMLTKAAAYNPSTQIVATNLTMKNTSSKIKKFIHNMKKNINS